MRRFDPAILDLALAAGVLAVSLPLAASAGRDQPGTHAVDGLAFAVTAVCGAALAMRRRWPLPVAAVAGAGLVVFTVRGYPGGGLILPVGISLYTAGTMTERLQALLVGAVATAMVALRAVTMPAGQAASFTWGASGWVLAALVWGVAVRARRQALQALRQRAEAAERTKEQEAARRVADERLRIARDLHDVIGHSFVTVHLQARVAATALDSDPSKAREALTAIETSSRDALREIRQTLSVLRTTGEETAAVGLDGLETLLEPLRAAGLSVQATVDLDGGGPIPVVMATGVFRIVQEALTNVLKHANARTVRVRVVRDGDGITAEVIDDGTGPATGAGEHGGHGLAGMAERAAAFGGRMAAGPRPGGGFAVTAHLPVTG